MNLPVSHEWKPGKVNTMDSLLNPNIAYLAMLVGTLLAILAAFVPGTGLIEIAALFTLIFAGWEIYNLAAQLNVVALIVIILGVIPLMLAMRKSGKLIYLVISILALVLGSAFLFHGERWWLPAVDPLLALVASSITAIFLWIVVRKSMEAYLAPPAHMKSLIGEIGEATTDINDEGTVQLESELWSARSKELIQAGSDVRVIGREGFTLVVEKAGQR
jgi:membrane-bound serine protease (ClpP class)